MTGIENSSNVNREERVESVDPRRLQGEAGKLLRRALVAVLTGAAMPSPTNAHAPDMEIHTAKDVRRAEEKRGREVIRHIYGDPKVLQGVKNRNTRMTIEHAVGEFNDEVAQHLNALQPVVMEFDTLSRQFVRLYDVARKKPDARHAASPERNNELATARTALQSLMGVGYFIDDVYVDEITDDEHETKLTRNKVIDPRIIARDPRLRSRLHHFTGALKTFFVCDENVRIEALQEMFAKEAEWIDDWKRIKKAFERDGESQI